MPGHRGHGIDFKHQVVAEHHAGERLSRAPDTALSLLATGMRTDSVAGKEKKSGAELNEKVTLEAIRGEAVMRGPRRRSTGSMSAASNQSAQRRGRVAC